MKMDRHAEGQAMTRRRGDLSFRLSDVGLVCLALLTVTAPSYAIPIPGHDAHEGIALVPEFGHLGPKGTLTFWQLPKGPVRKVLLILGAMDSSPLEWWDHSPSCPACKGLPENRLITLDALSVGYAVLMPNSLVANGDWSDWPLDSPDVMNLVNIISEWRLAQGMENVPTVAFGASAGARCLCSLGLMSGMFESMVHMISPGRLMAWEAATKEYPPTFFIHMPKDTLKAKGIMEAMEILEARGVPTGEVRWYEQPLTPDWFSRSIPGMQLATSEAIFNALKTNESLVGADNYLKEGNFEDEWYNMVNRLGILSPDPRNDGSFMYANSAWQEIKVAYARHVTIARRNAHMFCWFEGAPDPTNTRRCMEPKSYTTLETSLHSSR